MVTLHLNEQSDAKLLIGIYTTGDQPGTFVWKPGVLTTAVQEGRWILIEDLDRAPNDIIGTLLPLIENRELLIPSQKQNISASQGFRILATVRTHLNHRGEETKPLSQMLGTRHWQHVSVEVPPVSEQSQIARKLYPSLVELLPQLMAVFERLEASRQRAVLVGQSKTGILRAISPRDLLKWCGRVHRLLQQRTSFSSSDVDDIFMEAVDCFIGALPEGSARNGMAAVIAEELRIDPQRRDYLLTEREVRYDVDNVRINVGRYSLPRAQQQKLAPSSFSTNPHTSRMLERVAAAVVNREPLLLVGETGVGKTTAVQHLARHLGKKLEPFNLSQQSEAGDLLGGFKPVTARSLIVPMKDEFDELFRSSFSMTKNQQFLELLAKQMTKSNWKGVCKLWRQALKMVDQQRPVSPSRQGEAPSKKRKVENKKTPDFAKWDEFAASLGALEKRFGTGSEGFAFSFVEGNIVKAVRNGDWVLLDEINLASPDTLESITDLLDPSAPSLLLTEAGNIERIEAHPDFRVFAAMNPATDVGKKDLPPGIRSRFTELYVESPDKDIKSLQSIVRSYLRTEAAADAAIAMDVSTLYQRVVALADDNKLVDGAGQKPHFSLRTLTRTLSFSKYIAPQCNIRRALYEGFQMSFLTFLDLESARLVQPLLEQHLFGKRGNIRAELNKALRKPEDGRQYVQGWPGSKHWVRRGREELSDQPHYILTPFIRSNLENLVRASSTRQFPVLIQGPTSSGKTSMIEYLAGRTGHKFVRINNHEHTDLQEYLGTYVSGADGRLQFQEGILVGALREGHWIVLDELNLAPTDVLEALNRLLDDNRELLVPETQETVRPHEDFMLFATQNPAGLYGGRKTLSRAFRNRFLELHFDDIPVDELQEILHRRTHLPESRSKRLVTVYRELSVLRQENRLFEQKSFATLRDLFRWALRPNDTIEQLAANGFMLLAERVRKPEERQALKEILEKVMSRNGPRVVIDESALYSQDSPEVRQFIDSSPNQGVVWTKAMRRLYVLVSRAIQNNEPVLLVGETGCGKTTVCQMLADALKQRLHTVNAHQNTETGDLIGSQRPVRNRAVVEATLRQGLLASAALQGLEEAASLSTDALLDAYDQAVSSLDAPQKQAFCQSHAHADIQTNRTRYKALFEWVDGSLVQAMKEGSFFLLDEISLADDSVLERINSVLESQRTILLAEKGSLDAFVTADSGFQFFATMNPGGDYGKRELSPALRNRFTEIWVPALSDSEDIVQIVSSKLKPDARHCATAIVGFAQWFKARYNTSATSSISIRDALAWVQFV
ncbi:midasin, partial [Hortaea werneckii]